MGRCPVDGGGCFWLILNCGLVTLQVWATSRVSMTVVIDDG